MVSTGKKKQVEIFSCCRLNEKENLRSRLWVLWALDARGNVVGDLDGANNWVSRQGHLHPGHLHPARRLIAVFLAVDHLA